MLSGPSVPLVWASFELKEGGGRAPRLLVVLSVFDNGGLRFISLAAQGGSLVQISDPTVADVIQPHPAGRFGDRLGGIIPLSTREDIIYRREEQERVWSVHPRSASQVDASKELGINRYGLPEAVSRCQALSG